MLYSCLNYIRVYIAEPNIPRIKMPLQNACRDDITMLFRHTDDVGQQLNEQTFKIWIPFQHIEVEVN